ncbi:MAG: phosphatase PAP2 family protein [Clostridia bacterium]|nr:phosphatase PAP2 family protein [Clostridia bacterium]
MEKPKKNFINKTNLMFILSGVIFALFLFLIILLKTIDVEIVLLTGKKIGLASINKSLFESLGTSEIWYNITEIIGYFSLLVVGVFAALGVIQLVKRRSLKAVDKDIIVYGLGVCLLIVFYILFEIIVVNYRPILLDGSIEAEASFPSSHTLLVLGIMGMTAFEINDRISNNYIKWVGISGCILISLIMVIGRLLSGVHWFTDILGGVLLASSLVLLFYSIICKISKNNNN